MPQPMTMTVSMSVTWARDTAWKPTLMGSTKAQSRTESPSAVTTFCQGTAASSAHGAVPPVRQKSRYVHKH